MSKYIWTETNVAIVLHQVTQFLNHLEEGGTFSLADTERLKGIINELLDEAFKNVELRLKVKGA